MLNVEPRGLLGLFTKPFGKKREENHSTIVPSSHSYLHCQRSQGKASFFSFLELVAMILTGDKIVNLHAPLQQVQVGMVKLNQTDWSSNPALSPQT